MEDLTDLKRRIQNVSDNISLSKNSGAAEAYRSISSSIGTETPLGVLTEIREGQSRILESIKDLSDTYKEIETSNQRRHQEMCTILLGIAERDRNASQVVTKTSSVTLPSLSSPSRGNYYYGSHSISNGNYLIACILMHIDSMLHDHPRFKKLQNTDSTHMDVKDWYNICTAIFNADKQSKVGLRIPKPTDDDFREAVVMVASSVSGRKPACDASHLTLLLSKCPAMMATVEWTRTAILKCTGLLSPERTCRLRLIKYPFVTEESELLIETAATLKMPNRWFHQDVLNMKATPKKEYIRLVLEESVKPVDAIGMVKVKQ